MFRLRRGQTFRTTGASIELEIKYTNTKNERADPGHRDLVKATLKATVQTGAWSSVGATATYSQYPKGDAGKQTCVATLHCPPSPRPPPPPPVPQLDLDYQPTASPSPAHRQPTASHDGACPRAGPLPGGSSLRGTSRA